MTHTILGATLGDVGKAALFWLPWTCSHGRRGAQQGHVSLSSSTQPVLESWGFPCAAHQLTICGVSEPWLVLLTGSEPLSYALVLLVHSPQVFTGLLCLGVNARSLASLPFPCHMLTHTCTHMHVGWYPTQSCAAALQPSYSLTRSYS